MWTIFLNCFSKKELLLPDIMQDWIMKPEKRIRRISFMTEPLLLLQRMHLEWGLINPMWGMWSITICRRVWRIIIRRQDVQGVTERIPSAFYCFPHRMLWSTECFWITKIFPMWMKRMNFSFVSGIYEGFRSWKDIVKQQDVWEIIFWSISVKRPSVPVIIVEIVTENTMRQIWPERRSG